MLLNCLYFGYTEFVNFGYIGGEIMARKKYTAVEHDKIKKISFKLKHILNLQGITQNDLSLKTGLAASTISDYVNGKTLISPGNMQKITETLDITEDTLTGEELIDIIEDRRKELGITLLELSEMAKVPHSFLLNLENCFAPGPEDYDYVTRIAKILNLRPGRLQTALARLEPPSYDYSPIENPADVFTVIEDDDPILTSHFPNVHTIPKESSTVTEDHNTTRNPPPIETPEVKNYSFDLSEEEHVAVLAFLEVFRQIKQNT